MSIYKTNRKKMKNSNGDDFQNKKFSRREFLNTLGLTTAGLLVAPSIKSINFDAYGHEADSSFLTQVAVTEADNYDRSLIKQKVQHLFESIDGIGDVVKPGNKVGIKINLTGGSGYASNPKLNGKPITESMWTHPEVLRAVGELIIDSGVSGSDIYIVEALWDAASYNNFGYLEVQQSLGAQLVNLNKKEPYADFIDKEVGENCFFYSSFKLNQILNDIDVYVSIPKMKQHYDAGVTHSLKNQIGIVPIQFYMQNMWDNMRSKLHFEGGDIGTHLPRAICDLNLARPVHLAVIDGIKNAVGGEGTWNPTFKTAGYHVLLAGKDPVATDSIASYLMGNDPEAEKLQLPDGIRQCDNYLELLHQRGVGTNQMREIEVVGDGAGLVTSVRQNNEVINPDHFQLFQNFPNPFNQSTTINFYLPQPDYITLKLYSITGQEIETLVADEVPEGQHEINWTAQNLASGVYIYKLQVGRFFDSKKLIYQK
ncbi:MAG: DUF362 domain-containing protein [bacterium]|nr:MAG: DUF362 domain-containing protein [bacterium]